MLNLVLWLPIIGLLSIVSLRDDQSIRKAEQFWVNNDFQSSTNEIIIFLKTIQDGDDKI